MDIVEQQQDLSALAQRLTETLGTHAGSRSRWALQTALGALEADGVAGVLVITIPPKKKDFVDIAFTCGAVDVTHRWSVA